MLTQLLKDAAIPKFSGEPCDFDDFRWQFERHITNIESAQKEKIQESVKIAILEKTLPENERKWLMQLQKQGETVTAQSFLGRLGTRFNTSKETQIRKRWNDIGMKHGGRITVNDLHHFEMEFRQLRSELPTLGEEECYRHLLSKLPQHMTGWIVEEETRLNLTQPQVSIVLPRDYAPEGVRLSISAMIGTPPVTVQKVKPANFILTFNQKNAAKAILEFNGKRLQGGTENLVVKELPQRMLTELIFEFLYHRLEGRDRTDQFCRNNTPVDRFRSPSRDPRFVRVTEVDDQESRRRSPGPRRGRRGRSRSVSPAGSAEVQQGPDADGQSKRSKTPPAAPASNSAPTSKKDVDSPPSQDTRTTWKENRGKGFNGPKGGDGFEIKTPLKIREKEIGSPMDT